MTFNSSTSGSISNLLNTYNAFGSTYLSSDGDYYSYPNRYRDRGNLTGAVIQYYNNGQVISEETIDFDEKNNEELKKVRKDLLAAQEEHAKKACLRLTNCVASEDGKKIYTYDTGEDMTDKVLAELRGDNKRLVFAGSDVVDVLSSIDPVCFEGWELVVVDAEVKENITDLPKSIDGFTDETVEEYAERIRERGRVKRAIEKQAVRDAEIDKGLQMTQRMWDPGRWCLQSR